MLTLHNPQDVQPPFAPLSWGVGLAKPQRMVFVSGQVGADVLGRIPDDFIDQCRLTWNNVGSVLRDAGMVPADIVRTGIFITRHAEMTEETTKRFNALRVAFLGDHRPASTMIMVHALMNPHWLVEIDAVAVA